MANDNLRRLAESAHAWTTALDELARSQETSVGDLQTRLTEAERELSALRNHIKSTDRSEKILKWAEIAAAVSSLVVAAIIGFITVKLSDKANKIQESLASISTAQVQLVASANNQSSVDQLLDVLKEIGKPEGLSESDQTRLLNKALNHVDGVPNLTMEDYKPLMAYVLVHADTTNSKIFWAHHPLCVDCVFDSRAMLVGIEIDYLKKITDKDQTYNDSRLDADSALALLNKFVKTTAAQAQYAALSQQLGVLTPAKQQSIKRNLGGSGNSSTKTDSSAPPPVLKPQ